MQAFPWTDSLLVGVQHIDDQHKQLISRINALLEVCSSGEVGDTFTEMIDFLQAYVVEHFGDEERAMKDASYPGLAAHLAQHRVFVEQFLLLKADLQEKGPQAHVVLKANSLLVAWLKDHICVMDRAMGTFLRAQSGQADPSSPTPVKPEDLGAPAPRSLTLQDEIQQVTDQVSRAVSGDFTQSLQSGSEDKSLQRLCHALNFLLEAIRGKSSELEQKSADQLTQLDTIERQKQAIYELGTPILELWNGILVLPVVGFIDSRRAQQVMERLLAEVCARQASFVIIDVTGVAVLDTQTADYFSKIFNSLRLLGTQPVLTGIQPSVAQTLVEIGVTLDQVITLRNLRQGFQECLRLVQTRGAAPAAVHGQLSSLDEPAE